MKFIYLFLFIIFFTDAYFPQNISNQEQQKNEFKYKSPHVIRLSPSQFKMNKLKSIPFSSFSLSDFNIGENEIIRLKNGKSLSSKKFLEEINEIEKKLNGWGYSLRDKNDDIILGELIFPYPLVSKQKKILELSNSNILPDGMRTAVCGIQSEENLQEAIKSTVPQEPWPINYKKEWSASFGNEILGIDIAHNFAFEGEEKNSNLFASGETHSEISLTFFYEKISTIKLTDKLYAQPLQNRLTVYVKNDKAIDDLLTTPVKKTYSKNLDWETTMEFSLGPFDLEGSFNVIGKAGLTKNFSPASFKINEDLTPFVDLDINGKMRVGLEVAEAGIEGKIKLIDNTLSLSRTLELKNPGKDSYFNFKTRAKNDLKALSGKISAYIKIDYLIGSKKYLLVFYSGEGVSSTENLFSININQPAKRDRNLWLEITKISGITTHTARNEKIDIIPKSFEITVEAAGQSFSEFISDWNNDGVIDTPLKFKLPLLSSCRIPILISVKEKYKIGDLLFNSYLDLMKGESKYLLLCYDPISREIFGSIKGKEQQEVVSTGDTNYFGERNHSIRFKLAPAPSLKGAPSKAK